MDEIETTQAAPAAANSFYDRPQTQKQELPIGPGIPLGIERVSNPEVGIGGAYGSWGKCYDNATLPDLIEERLGQPLRAEERLHLSELGFLYRHHLPNLSDEEDVELEVEVGARLLTEAARANGWSPADIPESALKISIHKACDGSVAGLHLALNPELPVNRHLPFNVAEALRGKKILVGGIEGLSRLLRRARDLQALQLFGTGAGVIGVIPGRTIKFLVGGTHEVYDEEGLLQLHMFYPHTGARVEGQSAIEVTQAGEHHFRLAGLMHEPEDKAIPVVMAGPMGMVKLFVRSGVIAVRNVYQSYQKRIAELGLPGKEIAVAIVHHANLKINQLKEKQLHKEGIRFPMPWLLNDFGNVSAASNMIAFLRELASLKPGDHVLFDGFGAGTYYDVLAVEVGG
jgi:hypothetical protein